MSRIIQLPFYAKLSLVLLSLIALTYILYIGQDILIPVMMAFLFAILLRPIVAFFKTKLRFPHVIAAMFTVLLFVITIMGIIVFLSFQVSDFVSDFEKIEKNVTIHASNIQQFIKENFNFSSREQDKYLNEAASNSLEKGKEQIGTSLMFFTDTILNLIIIPIYTFLILLYRTHFMLFLCKLVKIEYHNLLQDIVNQVKFAVRNYIVGLIIEMIVVTILTTIGLMIIGVEYAILLGIITGLLNLIPYVGILFAGFLTIVASLTGSPDLSIILGVIIVNVVVQLIDNNILVPVIVNSKVEINALVSIVGIIVGGSIAGVSGMFLAIPVLAILKVIFDRIAGLEPWGYFMGDDLPKTYVWNKIKLPLYDYENSEGTTSVTTFINTQNFTETTTSKEEEK